MVLHVYFHACILFSWTGTVLIFFSQNISFCNSICRDFRFVFFFIPVYFFKNWYVVYLFHALNISLWYTIGRNLSFFIPSHNEVVEGI